MICLLPGAHGLTYMIIRKMLRNGLKPEPAADPVDGEDSFIHELPCRTMPDYFTVTHFKTIGCHGHIDYRAFSSPDNVYFIVFSDQLYQFKCGVVFWKKCKGPGKIGGD